MSDSGSDDKAGDAAQPAQNPVSSPQVGSRPTKDEQPDGETGKQKFCRKPRTAPIWVEAVCAILLVGITGTYTCYTRGQLRQLLKSTKAAEDAAKAAGDNAKTAKDTLEEIRKGGSDTHSLAVAAGKQADATKHVADAAGTQAKMSVTYADAAKSLANIARDALVRVQRPWLGVDGLPTMLQPLKPSEADLSVTVKNFGTAPALHVGVMMGRASSFKPEDVKRQADAFCDEAVKKTEPLNPGEEGAGQYIFPGNTGNTITRRFVEVGGNMTPDTQFGLIGCIVYYDQFKGVHHTRFCFTSGVPIAETTNQPLTACPFSQDAD